MLRYWTAGESHGRTLLALIDGFPAGLEIDYDMVDIELARRQGGYGRGGRQKLETDKLEVLTGIWQGRTLGSPLTLQVINADYKLERLKRARTSASWPCRSSRSDQVFGIDPAESWLTPVARARQRSACVRGMLARQLLRVFGIETIGYVTEIGGLAVTTLAGSIAEQGSARDASSVYTLVPSRDAESEKLIDQATDDGGHARWRHGSSRGRFANRSGDTRPVGSKTRWQNCSCCDGSPSHQGSRDRHGLRSGSPPRFTSPRCNSLRYFAKAFAEFKEVLVLTNNAGGLEGGMTNGQPLVASKAEETEDHIAKTARSPFAWIPGREPAASYERSDVSAVSAASVIIEHVVVIPKSRRRAGRQVRWRQHNRNARSATNPIYNVPPSISLIVVPSSSYRRTTPPSRDPSSHRRTISSES